MRFAQSLPEPIARCEREVDRFRCTAHQPEQKLFLGTSVTDLAKAEEATVAVDEEWVFDAALREHVVLHADGEEMIEGAAAQAHDIADPDRPRASG